ncbi:hypothetical protein GBAR_LOCUS4046 [Geodia barretti]|uniref:Secreted protein n=1 Tax=Geodia barretti TaxID=519541 RepID=A0AA35R5E2_GEOBA|nr:hypothetical protein GBAR_LOCUS4046 [Geodia barretti]
MRAGLWLVIWLTRRWPASCSIRLRPGSRRGRAAIPGCYISDGERATAPKSPRSSLWVANLIPAPTNQEM